jgi:hypothetical protein
MNKFLKILNKETMLLILFIVTLIIIQIISNYRKMKINIQVKTDNIRPSYGDEYYNYYGGDNIKDYKKPADNIQELIIEGFSNHIEAIRQTHTICPVMEGNVTQYVDSIQYPNNMMQGLPGPVEGCFYVSTCCNNCFDQIQDSLRQSPESRIYDIIYRDNYYRLTKNGEEKQVVFPCNQEGILDLIREHADISPP